MAGAVFDVVWPLDVEAPATEPLVVCYLHGLVWRLIEDWQMDMPHVDKHLDSVDNRERAEVGLVNDWLHWVEALHGYGERLLVAGGDVHEMNGLVCVAAGNLTVCKDYDLAGCVIEHGVARDADYGPARRASRVDAH